MKMTKSEAGKLGAIISAEKAREQKLKRVEEYNKNPKLCAYCSQPIPYEKQNTNKFCSSSCAASYNNIHNPANHHPKDKTKVCLHCGKSFTPSKHVNGKFCSTKCSNDYHYIKYITQWKNGELDGMSGIQNTSRHIKRYIREKFNMTCTECGTKEIILNGKSNMEVHHIDGNYKNNSEDNLTLLCTNCHRHTDSYGSKNTGKGRDRKMYTEGTQEYEERIKNKKVVTQKVCRICGAPIDRAAELCVPCLRKQQAANIPPKETLLEELKNFTSFLAIGRKYGVSDNAVRKWCKKYDLPYKASDIKKLTNS